MSGWIKLNRSIADHWLFQDSKKLKWWLIILLEVNFKDAKMLVGNKLIEVKKGESVKSLRTWAAKFGTTPKTTKQFLLLLAQDKLITTKSIGFSTHLTVCDYDSYKETVNTFDHTDDYKKETVGKQLRPHERPTIEERKKERKKSDDPKNQHKDQKEEKGVAAPKLDTIGYKGWDFSFVREDMRLVFADWLIYKKQEHRDVYKSPESLKSCYRQLLELSSGDNVTAEKIIEQSKASRYKGLFALKEGNKSGTQGSGKRMEAGARLSDIERALR